MTFFCSFISWHHFLSCTDVWWHQDETNLTYELTEFSIHNLIYFCLNGKFFKNYLSRHVSLTFVYCFCWQGSSISWNRVEKIVLKTKHLHANTVSQIYSLVIHRHLRVRLDHWFIYSESEKYSNSRLFHYIKTATCKVWAQQLERNVIQPPPSSGYFWNFEMF